MTESENNYGRNDPLHAVTLKAALTALVDHYGWDELARRIRINCFANDPSLNSSLKFLRKTPWARNKVEQLYLQTVQPPVQDSANNDVYGEWPKPTQ